MGNNKKESKISDHKQHKKQLIPPFLQINNLAFSSWIDERLPEMIWAVLVIGNLEREKALAFFRDVADFVKDNPECYDITMTGIKGFTKPKREEFIKRLLSWSSEIKDTLRPIALFPDLPAIEDWKSNLETLIPEDDWQKLLEGVKKTLWHQSEEATDCRWIRVLCSIVGGKMKLMKEPALEIVNYPNYGDLRRVRPTIRSTEIQQGILSKDKENKWPKDFWQHCFNNTACFPEEAVNNKIRNRRKKLSDDLEKARKHYFGETIRVRKELINYFFGAIKPSAMDSRHEGSFGLALYGLTLFIEIIFYRAALSVTGRIALRALVETYITFAYLLKKEKDEPKVWDDYRSYGTGQIKLIYLKLKELDKNISSVELSDLDAIANEDKWTEFVPINLGHWVSADLRKMSIDVGLKDIYDKFYNYTSGFTHANWGAVREAIYQKCMNPLHRLHNGPITDLPLMPSVTADAQEIANKILDCLSDAYPTFDVRIKSPREAPGLQPKGINTEQVKDSCLTLDDFNLSQINFDIEEIKRYDSEERFNSLAVELFKEVGRVTGILACAYLLDNENRPRKWKRDEAILGGLMIRANKLQQGLLDQICQDRMEITWILFRCLVETLINLKYLLEKNNTATFNEYIEYSLRTEKQLLNLINENIKKRGHEIPIENRMKQSVEHAFKTSAFSIEEVNEKSREPWGGTIYKRAKKIKMEKEYLAFFSFPSHAVHGNWQDLIMHHLQHENEEFSPNPDWGNVRPQFIFGAALLSAEINQIYLNKILPNSDDKNQLDEYNTESIKRIRKADELHEAFLQKQ